MSDNRDKDYSEVINSTYELAEVIGKDNPEIAWLYLEDAYHWPNPHYKGEPVCNPEAGPDCKDGQQFNPRLGPSLRERYEAHKEKNK